MASRKKTPSRNKAATRFDFSKDAEPDPTQTGTLRELLDELDPRYAPAEGAAISLGSLKTNLDFIEELTGRRYKSLTEAIPLWTLKTIKLLYIQNKASGIQLFQHLHVPSKDTKNTKGAKGAKATKATKARIPTLEFRITGETPRNRTSFKFINEILTQVALEIPTSPRLQ